MRVLAAVAIALCVAALPSHAALLEGETILAQYFFPDLLTPLGDPQVVVVGAGPEVAFAPFVVDFSDTNILITAVSQPGQNVVEFDGFAFIDFGGTIPAFTNVTINAASNYGGSPFPATHVGFTADAIFVNFENRPGEVGQFVLLDIAGPREVVPEPTTVLLCAGGLFTLAAIRRRRNHNV